MLKTYETLIIFAESVKDENMDAAMDAFQAEVERQGGAVVDRIPLGRRSFARPLKKRDSGFYGKVIMEMAPDKVVALRQRCKYVNELFRLQITLLAKGYRKATDDEPAVEAEAAEPVAIGEES